MAAIREAGLAMGISATDGVVLAGEKKVVSELLDNDRKSEKMVGAAWECDCGRKCPVYLLPPFPAHDVEYVPIAGCSTPLMTTLLWLLLESPPMPTFSSTRPV